MDKQENQDRHGGLQHICARGHLQLQGVGVTYPGGFCVFKEINLDIRRGQFIAVVGLSGHGKTTLIRVIGALIPHSDGRVLLDGTEIDEKNRGREFSYVFQNPVLLPWRTVLGNVMLPAEIFQNGEVAARAEDMIRLVGLAEFKNAYPDQLSGGMKARVAIARALTYKPTLLLMDEPFGDLDEINRNKMNLELLRIWETTKTTTVFVTHSLEEATFLADRIVVLGPPPSGIVADILNDSFRRPRDLSLLDRAEFAVQLAKVRSILRKTGNDNK